MLGCVTARSTSAEPTPVPSGCGSFWEHLADVLSEDEQPLTAVERQGVLTLAERMCLGERVPRALTLCPER